MALTLDGEQYGEDAIVRDARGRIWQLRRTLVRRRFDAANNWIWCLLGSDRSARGRPVRPLTLLELREPPKPPVGPDPVKYPQHHKCWQLEQDQIHTQSIGLFLDTTQYRLCELDRHTDRYEPVRKPIEKILAEHYVIDYQALMAEKDEMLREIREANRG